MGAHCSVVVVHNEAVPPGELGNQRCKLAFREVSAQGEKERLVVLVRDPYWKGAM